MARLQRKTGLEIAQQGFAQAEYELGDQIDSDVALEFVNQGLAELHELLTESYEDFFIAEHDFVAGTEEQALPEDFFRAIKLFDTSDGSEVRRVTLKRLQQAQAYPSYWSGLHYRILGWKVYFSEAPSSVVRLYYVPQFQPLADLGQEVSFPVPVSWYRYVVADITARILAYEESPYTFYEGRKQQMAAQMREMASVRDMEPEPFEDRAPVDILEL